jgi:hypothetical protein
MEIAMRRVAAMGVALVAIAIFGSGTAAQEKLQKLSGSQIRARLAGMDFTDEVHWRDSFERGGKVASTSMGRKRTGKWRVYRDQFCIEFDKEPPEKCYEVWASGKKVELRGEGLLTLQGIVESPIGRK